MFGFASFMYHLLTPPRVVVGRRAVPYRLVRLDCRDPFYLRPFWV